MQRVGDKKRVPALRRRAPRVLSCALVFLLLIVLTARVGHAVAGDLSAGTHSGVSAPPLDIQTAATAGDVQKLSEDVVVQTPTEINAAEVESAVISLNGSRSDESPSSEVPSDLPTSSISPSSSAEESTAEEEPTVVPSHVQNSKLDRSGTDLKEERDDVAPPKEESGTGSTKVVSEVNNAGVDTLRDRDASRGEDYPAVNGSAVLLSSSSSSSVVETEANSTPSSSLSSRSSEAPSTTASSVTPAQKGERMRSEAGIPPTAAAFSADTSPTLIPKNFEPMPSKDQRFRDDYVDPDELVYQGDINRDDLIHHPLAFNLCFNLFSGLQLNSFTTSGVIVSAEERAALREYRWRNPNRTYREEVESQKMLFNMKESGCCGLPLAEENAANVEPDIPIVQAGDDDDEAMVVDDNTASAPPPVVGSRPASPILTPHQLLERMIQGDSVDHPLSLLTITDRYFVENMDPGIFTATLCDYFVELLHIPNRPPLVVNMFNWQAARFTMRCLFYRSHALKNARRKFVVLASEGDPSACASFFLDGSLSGETHITVSYLANHPLLAHWYGVNGNVRHPKFTTLPIGFLFFFRSGRHLRSYDEGRARDDESTHLMFTKMFLHLLDLNKMFPHIDHPLVYGRRGLTWLEDALDTFADNTVDPAADWIALDQLPQRITTIYIVAMPLQKEKRPDRPSLTDQVLIFKEEEGNLATSSSQHIALLPFTAALFHKLKQHPFGDPLRENKVITAFSVWDWRKEVWDYFEANPSIAVFPRGGGNGRKEFFSVLNNYTFVMSPMGYGFECYRHWEALAFGAIPIIQHPKAYEHKLTAVGHDGEINYRREVESEGLLDLYKDLPVVAVRSMSDITPESLELWRKEIYEKFRRGEYNMEKMFAQYWIDQIYGHTNDL